MKSHKKHVVRQQPKWLPSPVESPAMGAVFQSPVMVFFDGNHINVAPVPPRRLHDDPTTTPNHSPGNSEGPLIPKLMP